MILNILRKKKCVAVRLDGGHEPLSVFAASRYGLHSGKTVGLRVKFSLQLIERDTLMHDPPPQCVTMFVQRQIITHVVVRDEASELPKVGSHRGIQQELVVLHVTVQEDELDVLELFEVTRLDADMLANDHQTRPVVEEFEQFFQIADSVTVVFALAIQDYIHAVDNPTPVVLVQLHQVVDVIQGGLLLLAQVAT